MLPVDPDRLRPLLRLLLAPGMHSAAAARLLRAFGGDAERVLAAPREGLARVPGVGPALAAAVAEAAATPAEADREAARAAGMGVALLGPGDPAYPLPLIHTFDPPPVLYVRGAWLPGDVVAVAVVGSRRASAYGTLQAGRLARGLAAAGVTVVSGLARGVDTAAHRGALAAPGGRTVAVLGSGLARPYPAENLPLLEEAAARGAVLSEFPLDTPPHALNFPRRNRVLAALALATVVVEASESSGSLITAHLAAELGKDVAALPGRVDAPGSRGANGLLKEGAALVEGPEDVLALLEIPGLSVPVPLGRALPGPALPGDRPADRVLAALEGEEALAPDSIAAATGLPGPAVRAALADLEIRGAVRAFPGGRFARP
jgi:DNA processing protein